MKRALWWASVAVMAGAVVLVAWLPGFRLSQEIAGARNEGLWTEAADVRKAVGPAGGEGNAAAMVQAAMEDGKARGISEGGLVAAMGKVLKGNATEAQKRAVRDFCGKNEALAARWRAASAMPRLVFDRPWEDGLAVLYRELAPTKQAVRFLAASAEMGLQPRANLLAAARLSALMGQDPALISQIVRVSLGLTALREAKRLHLEREVEAALGPPIDARRVYAFEFSDVLQTIGRLDEPGWKARMWTPGHEPDDGFLGKLRRTGVLKANGTRKVVQRWREFWREMPREGTDYDGAIRALERRMPAAERAASEHAEVFRTMSGPTGDPKETSMAVRAFARFEAERKAARV